MGSGGHENHEPKDGLPIKIYSLSKRRNSTKQPNDVWFYVDPDGDLLLQTKCTFKEPTDIYEPTVILAIDRENTSDTGSGEYDSYWLATRANYAHFNGRYYWITGLKSMRRDHWEITLAVDPLATYKNWIGETKVFAEYWGGGNIEFIDTRLPRRTNGKSASAQFGSLFTSGRQYIVGVISETGFKYYDVQSYQNLQVLLSQTATWLDNVIENIINNAPDVSEESGWASGGNYENMGAISTNIKVMGKQMYNAIKYIKDGTEWVFNSIYLWLKSGLSKDKIASMITSVMFYPVQVAPISSGVESIKLGDFDTGVSGKRIDTLTGRFTGEYSVPGNLGDFNYAWYRRGQFCSWSLYVPYFGVVQIPSDLIVAGSSIITIEANLNIPSGACNFRVALKSFAAATSAITLSTGNCQLGGYMNVGTQQQNTAGATASIVGAVAGAALAVAGNEFGAAKGLAMQISGASSAAANAIHFGESMTPIGTSISGASGGVALEPGLPEGTITLTRYNFEVSASQDEIRDTIGTPKFAPATVKSCSGYVKASGASFECRTASAAEIDIVNSYLNNGMYYE